MSGEFVVERGNIADALAILLNLVRHLRQFNPRARSRSNVTHHYDLDVRLYDFSTPTSK
ncbi:hypothetical protein [Bradyrhizobium sp. CCGUVB14]|uniref:hypothetical protein n=1 Tax=Bradyrhizobium sp. CCGUVB14 TaxID=2949628 RepID=UPI0021146644|nr:hypothetical protein [Bradyrhizobium sp. CCGUVB14]